MAILRRLLFRQFLCAGSHIVERTHIEKRLLGEIIGFAAADVVEALERVGDFACRCLSCR